MLTKLPTAILLCLTSIVSLGNAQSEFGEKLESNGTEIFYKGAVTENDAKRLAEYLIASEFTNGDQKSVQLLKEFGTWQFRMVTIEKFIDDPAMIPNYKFMCLELSDCFDGADVDLHACNEKLETQRVYQGHRGKRSQFDKISMYHLNVSEPQLNSVIQLLRGEGVGDTEASFYVAALPDRVKFHMVTVKDVRRDPGFLLECRRIAKDLSTKVFEGKIVEFHLCDEYMESVNFVANQADQ